ncbi:dipeptide ABC transporter ATP-binding protein [Azorhizobium doebereinerae]|uniref:ABC transporter ATP-binding protein n=1 Tax=Azorhizobium doebereinerae TaxID=281091 RepID=UPI00048D2242
MAAPVLSISNLSVQLPVQKHRVLDGISLDIAPGETLCLVGESGSGKSVTSLAVMGLLPKKVLAVSGGSIRLEGEELVGAGDARLRALRASRMAMIFQEPMTALNPVFPVGQQIEEVLKTHLDLSARARREKVLAMMEQVHLPNIERVYASYPHQLSGGQRQRIMIAMALILDPKLLIADEPTTALDVTTQKQILKLIKELQQRMGTSVLFITHDMGVVADIADRVCVMNHGQVVETGALDAILRSPREDYTRRLLGAVPSLTPRPPRPDAAREKVLSVSELAKTYASRSLFGQRRETVAADAVSFTLGRGRTLGIVGESGSGKSTVARCVMRLIDPTSGSIRLGAQEVSDLSPAALRPFRKRIQMIFQDPYRSLNPRITVGDSIAEGPRNFGVPAAEAHKRARDLMPLVGLPDDAVERFPHQFSGGQRQRIAIARALAMEPDVLVADEAVSALDVSVQAQVLDLLAGLQARLGIAILFITHDLRVAAQICDDVVVMHKGRIVEHGTAAEVLAHPRADYTRELLLAAPGRHWDFANFRPLAPAPALAADA